MCAYAVDTRQDRIACHNFGLPRQCVARCAAAGTTFKGGGSIRGSCKSERVCPVTSLPRMKLGIATARAGCAPLCLVLRARIGSVCARLVACKP